MDKLTNLKHVFVHIQAKLCETVSSKGNLIVASQMINHSEASLRGTEIAA